MNGSFTRSPMVSYASFGFSFCQAKKSSSTQFDEIYENRENYNQKTHLCEICLLILIGAKQSIRLSVKSMTCSLGLVRSPMPSCYNLPITIPITENPLPDL